MTPSPVTSQADRPLPNTDKTVFALLALQYTAGGASFYRLGFRRPAFAFAGGLLPMLAVLFE